MHAAIDLLLLLQGPGADDGDPVVVDPRVVCFRDESLSKPRLASESLSKPRLASESLSRPQFTNEELTGAC